MPLEKFLKFHFGLKHPKMSGDSGCNCLCPQVNCPFISQEYSFISRIALLFSRIAFLFPGIALLFHRIALLFSRSFFLFHKNALLFSRIALQFSRSVVFLSIVHVFIQECFFLANYSLSSSCSELLRQIIFALLLFCFLLKLFIDQFMVPCILLLFIFKQ